MSLPSKIKQENETLKSFILRLLAEKKEKKEKERGKKKKKNIIPNLMFYVAPISQNNVKI